MTADVPEWPEEADTERASAARVYDYLLGGTRHFLADRDAARSFAVLEPRIREVARASRAFIGRAVRFMVSAGVRQFVDIGAGIPALGSVHEVAQDAAPGSRVVYADIDPVAVAHARAILAGNSSAGVARGDLREPEQILSGDRTRSLIDFTAPVGLVLSAVLPHISDEENPWRVAAILRDALPPGSYLALSHVTNETRPEVASAGEQVYRRSVSVGIRFRPRGDILRFFDGFDLVYPGLVYVPQWRPDSPAAISADPSNYWTLAGVGRKP